MRSLNVISAQRVIALLIQAGAIESLNYNPAGPVPFSLTGTRLDLTNGDIQTPGFFSDGATGNVTVRGDITAESLTIEATAGTNLTAAAIDNPATGIADAYGLERDTNALTFTDSGEGVYLQTTGVGHNPPGVQRNAIVGTQKNDGLPATFAFMQATHDAGFASVNCVALATGARVSVTGGIVALTATAELTIDAPSLGAWSAIPLAAGFVSLGTAVYRIVGDLVHVRLAVAWNGVAPNPIATLPAGFRPTGATAIMFGGNDIGGIQTFQRFDITVAGAINANLLPAAACNLFVEGMFPIT